MVSAEDGREAHFFHEGFLGVLGAGDDLRKVAEFLGLEDDLAARVRADAVIISSFKNFLRRAGSCVARPPRLKMPRSPVPAFYEREPFFKELRRNSAFRHRPRNYSPSHAGVRSARTGRFSRRAFRGRPDRRARSWRSGARRPRRRSRRSCSRCHARRCLKGGGLAVRKILARANERSARNGSGPELFPPIVARRAPAGRNCEKSKSISFPSNHVLSPSVSASHHPSLLSAMTCVANFFPVCFFICGSFCTFWLSTRKSDARAAHGDVHHLGEVLQLLRRRERTIECGDICFPRRLARELEKPHGRHRFLFQNSLAHFRIFGVGQFVAEIFFHESHVAVHGFDPRLAAALFGDPLRIGAVVDELGELVPEIFFALFRERAVRVPGSRASFRGSPRGRRGRRCTPSRFLHNP